MLPNIRKHMNSFYKLIKWEYSIPQPCLDSHHGKTVCIYAGGSYS